MAIDKKYSVVFIDKKTSDYLVSQCGTRRKNPNLGNDFAMIGHFDSWDDYARICILLEKFHLNYFKEEQKLRKELSKAYMKIFRDILIENKKLKEDKQRRKGNG